MNKIIRSFIIIIFTSFLYSENEKLNIYLMEFNNLDKSLKYNHLTKDLPNFIIKKYSKYDNIAINYAGNIKPYLNKNSSNLLISNNYLILGSFNVDEEKIDIFYELIDYENWTNISSDKITIPLKDLGYLEEGFIDRIDDLLRPFVQLPIDYVYNEEKNTTRLIDENEVLNNEDENSLHIIEKNVITALDELEFYYDTYNKLKKIDLDRGQYGNRYYREFDLGQINKQALGYEKNTELLLKVFDDVLANPYNVMIGEMELNLTGSKDGTVNVQVPVEFSMKNQIIDEMLIDLPHFRDVREDGMIFYEFSAEHYLFSDDLLDYLSKIEYQVTPIIFLNDKIGDVKLIIIDSWKDKYDNFKSDKIPIMRKREFEPLFSIIPGTNNIKMFIDPSISFGNYKFNIKGNDLGSYSKMTVKFILENKLDQYLEETISELR